MPSNPRALELRLSREASKRIREHIDLCQLNILRCVPLGESKLKRLGLILNEAIRILEENNQSTGGCSDEAVVTTWLNRTRGKSITVFKALCQAVDEDWLEVFDRTPYTEILVGEQKRSIEFIMNSLFGIFTSSLEETNLSLSEYSKQIQEVMESLQTESNTTTDLINIFFKEFSYNGRQIKFRAISSSIPCPITAIEITGKNQNNNIEKWSFQYMDKAPYTIRTDNWWWKGEINIRFKLLKDEQQLNEKCKVFVPQRGYTWATLLFNLDNGTCDVN